jgi:hypothetical protein
MLRGIVGFRIALSRLEGKWLRNIQHRRFVRLAFFRQAHAVLTKLFKVASMDEFCDFVFNEPSLQLVGVRQWPGISLSCRTRMICTPECIVKSCVALRRFVRFADFAVVRLADLAAVRFTDLPLVRLVCFIKRLPMQKSSTPSPR